MVAGCGHKCLKYIFFTFNFLFFVCGAVILGVGLWVRFDNEFQRRLNDAVKTETGNDVPFDITSVYIALYIIIAIGGVLFLTGFLGCCGACCENSCLLGVFFTIVLVLFCVEIAGAIYLFVKKDTFRDEMNKWYKKAFVDNYQSNPDVKTFLDKIQSELKCCGAMGCQDYTGQAPSSCPSCTTVTPVPGCSNVIYDRAMENVGIIAGIAIAIVAIELLAMIFACVLCSAIRSGDF